MTQQFSAQLPNRDAAPIGDDRLLSAVWYNFMAFLASLTATPIEPVAVGVTPYSFEASTIGHLHVAAGTVTSVVLQRGGVSLSCPTSGFVPVVAGDSVTIDYAVIPTVNFVPAART